MKYIKVLLVFALVILFSCSNEKAKEKQVLVKMEQSFKIYIRDNDLRKDLVTKLEKVEALSFVELADSLRDNPEEIYEAKIHMMGTTSFMYSAKIYNMNDTVTCYFDNDMKMLRLVNPNQR